MTVPPSAGAGLDDARALAIDRFSRGQTWKSTVQVGTELVDSFARFSGDLNPLHMDSGAARAYGFPRRVAHGVILMARVSEMIGMEIPGAGAVWRSANVEWIAPVFVGDEIEIVITIAQVSAATGMLRLQVESTNQDGKVVMKGSAEVKLAAGTAVEPRAVAGERVAVVTGGSRGIGAEAVTRLAADGFRVAIVCRAERERGEEVAVAVRDRGGTATLFAADLTDAAQTAALVESVLGEFGRVDVVVHAASPRLTNTKVAALTLPDLEPLLKTYVGGALALLGAVVPSMAQRRYGRILVLGTSYMRGTPPAGLGAYLVAKHALWGLVRSVAAELGPLGITCNMVSPSLTVTDFTADVPLRVKEVEAQRNPMRRLATTADAAAAIAFLASEAAGFVNGVDFSVAGGAVA